jgi:hypothetical protein
MYDETDEEACNWAFTAEGETPTEWDDIARQMLLEELSPEKYYA